MYNKICTTIIVKIILLILGEIWSKWSNFTSLLLVEVFAEVAEVNTEALNIKSCQSRQKHCRGKAEAKNAEIRGLNNNNLKYQKESKEKQTF